MIPYLLERISRKKILYFVKSYVLRSFGSSDEETRRRLAASKRHQISVEGKPPPLKSCSQIDFDNVDIDDDFSYLDLEQIPGFFEPRLLDAYQLLNASQLKNEVTGAVAEIGVYQGRSFIPLSSMRRRDTISGYFEEVAVAIDCFARQEYNRDSSGRGDISKFQKNLEKHGLFVDEIVSDKVVEKNAGVRDNPIPSSIVVIQNDSAALKPNDISRAIRNVFSMMPNGEVHNSAIDSHHLVRFFHIDGCHTEDAVKSDLTLANKCLLNGGIILLDDALNPDWPGVASGLHKYLLESWKENNEANALYPFAFGYNKCFLARGNKWTSLYRSSLHSLERKSAVFWGREVSILNHGFIAAHFGNDS